MTLFDFLPATTQRAQRAAESFADDYHRLCDPADYRMVLHRSQIDDQWRRAARYLDANFRTASLGRPLNAIGNCGWQTCYSISATSLSLHKKAGRISPCGYRMVAGFGSRP